MIAAVSHGTLPLVFWRPVKLLQQTYGDKVAATPAVVRASCHAKSASVFCES